MKILRILMVEDEDIGDLGPLIEATAPKDLTGEDWDDVKLKVAASQDEADAAAREVDTGRAKGPIPDCSIRPSLSHPSG